MGNRKALLLAALVCLLVLSVLLSLSWGKSLSDVWRGLFETDGFGLILKKLRIPRTIIALLVGGSLGMCGVVFQSILQNPLADPYTLGISGGASLGITLAALLGLQAYAGMWASPVMGFAGAAASVLVVYTLSTRRFFNPTNMVLFGIVTNLVFSSLVFFVFSIMDPDRMQITLMWIMGDLLTLDVSIVPYYIPLFVIPALVLSCYGKELDLLSLGSEKAHYLGLNPSRTYKVLFLVTSLLTGFCVSAAGIIGFVGLVVPHLLRSIAGAGHSFLLVSSFLGGAFFLIISDVLCRYLLYPVELPVGVVTGITGGVILLLLLLRRP